MAFYFRGVVHWWLYSYGKRSQNVQSGETSKIIQPDEHKKGTGGD